jgi:hypothetical protein
MYFKFLPWRKWFSCTSDMKVQSYPLYTRILDGCAIAQAVSCWLSTAATRVLSQVKSCGICGGQSGVGVGFLRVLRFPLPILIPSTAPQSSSGAGTIGKIVAYVPNGLSLTPPQGTKKLNYILDEECSPLRFSGDSFS